MDDVLWVHIMSIRILDSYIIKIDPDPAEAYISLSFFEDFSINLNVNYIRHAQNYVFKIFQSFALLIRILFLSRE